MIEYHITSYYSIQLLLLCIAHVHVLFVCSFCPSRCSGGPEALDCRVPIPPEAWSGLAHILPSLGFERQTSCI